MTGERTPLEALDDGCVVTVSEDRLLTTTRLLVWRDFSGRYVATREVELPTRLLPSLQGQTEQVSPRWLLKVLDRFGYAIKEPAVLDTRPGVHVSA